MDENMTVSFTDAFGRDVDVLALGGSLYYRDLTEKLKSRKGSFRYTQHSVKDAVEGNLDSSKFDNLLSLVGQYAFIYHFHRKTPFSIIRDCHTVGWWGHILQELLCTCLSTSSDVVFFPSKYAKDIYDGKISSFTSKKVGYGIDLPPLNVVEDARLSTHRDGTVRLCFIGRLGQDKNFVTVLRTFLRVLKKRPGVKLVVAGPSLEYPFGTNLEFVRKIIETAGAQSNFEYAGFISEKEKWRFYATSDIFIFTPTSLHESLCRTIIEAKYCGLPVISTRFGPVPELIEDKKSGILVDVTPLERKNVISGGPSAEVDVDQLVDACISLIDNVEMRKKIGDAGRSRMDIFRVENFLNEIEKTVQDIDTGAPVPLPREVPLKECTDLFSRDFLEFIDCEHTVQKLVTKAVAYTQSLHTSGGLRLGSVIPPEKIDIKVKEGLGDYLLER